MINQDKVIAVDYHRNGVGGAPFYVALVEDRETNRTLLVITFAGDGEEAYTAVIDPVEATRGNIYMHPVDGQPATGGNAWRGDRFAHRYRKQIIEQQRVEIDATIERINAETEARLAARGIEATE